MSVATCPTDIVHARPERIWPLLTIPQEVARWAEIRLVDGPDRPMQPGDVVVFAADAGLRVRWRIVDSAEPRELSIVVELPFGLENHEVIVVTPVDDASSRVTFN